MPSGLCATLPATGFPTDQRDGDKEFVIRRAATNRVLNVLRHWVSKHSQDFETNDELKCKVIGFLEEVMHDPELLTQERKAAANIIRTLTQEDPGDNQITLEEITQMAEGVKAEPFENHSALEIAEQLTLLDHLIFKKIPYEEFFGQGWMKLEKNEKTPYIMKTTKHFNDISNLIASEIIRNEDVNARVSAIEKWVAVADICRCLHNYNAVLEITSSMNRSAIFRLKKTWLKVSKQNRIAEAFTRPIWLEQEVCLSVCPSVCPRDPETSQSPRAGQLCPPPPAEDTQSWRHFPGGTGRTVQAPEAQCL